MTPQQLDVIQEVLNRTGYLPKGQAQRLIDYIRSLPEKPADESKTKTRRKPQAE